MTLHTAYKIISTILGLAIFFYIFNSVLGLQTEEALSRDIHGHTFLFAFICSSMVIGIYIWIAYEVYDRNIEWRNY